jgi:hypothetical protein
MIDDGEKCGCPNCVITDAINGEIKKGLSIEGALVLLYFIVGDLRELTETHRS